MARTVARGTTPGWAETRGRRTGQGMIRDLGRGPSPGLISFKVDTGGHSEKRVRSPLHGALLPLFWRSIIHAPISFPVCTG